MTTALPIRCRCGSLRGTMLDLSPERGIHAVCYCDDCQAFCRYLKADTLLDERGGTDIFQMAPASLRIEAGAEHLRCVRLSKKGLMRWYVGCCNTPIGNTMAWARMPFVGVVLACVDPSVDAATRERAIGRPRFCGFPQYARGGLPPGAPPSTGAQWIARMLRFLAGGFLRAHHRPSPFFRADGSPVAQPTVLSPSERADLQPRAAGAVG